ncbi:uncharacterized protein LOC132704895 isoform X3 [Cylas formicarius]|uniref:uncharacterized protein LOC132704895 isoform X3 n=1 Tax=Cylas formicarius TaxID=197179 RepID=UPI002958D77F|nr:uncharacterized protein LOC132704895 isoform X3 [Cylas formicarius]
MDTMLEAVKIPEFKRLKENDPAESRSEELIAEHMERNFEKLDPHKDCVRLFQLWKPYYETHKSPIKKGNPVDVKRSRFHSVYSVSGTCSHPSVPRVPATMSVAQSFGAVQRISVCHQTNPDCFPFVSNAGSEQLLERMQRCAFGQSFAALRRRLAFYKNQLAKRNQLAQFTERILQSRHLKVCQFGAAGAVLSGHFDPNGPNSHRQRTVIDIVYINGTAGKLKCSPAQNFYYTKELREEAVLEVMEDIELLAPLITDFVADVVFYPYETILHRLCVQCTATLIDNIDDGQFVVSTFTDYEGFMDGCAKCVAEEGAGGLYKGIGLLVLRYVVHFFIIWTTHHRLRASKPRAKLIDCLGNWKCFLS